jgi:hypothetical protein
MVKLVHGAIRWTALAILNDTLTLYPKTSLSKHIGFGKDSTNCEADDFNKDLKLADKNISDFDIDIKEDIQSLTAFIKFEEEIKQSSNQTSEKDQSTIQKVKIFHCKSDSTFIETGY